MQASQMRELTYKARAERRANFKDCFVNLLKECQSEAEAGRCLKVFPGVLDPVIEQMFRQNGYRVRFSNPNQATCPYCSFRHSLSDGNLDEIHNTSVCDGCRPAAKTYVMWGEIDGCKDLIQRHSESTDPTDHSSTTLTTQNGTLFSWSNIPDAPQLPGRGNDDDV
jgi:hypothetical protein